VLTLAQTNPTVGDLDGNRRRAVDVIAAAAREGAHLVVFPEMAVSGYPLQDLAARRSFVEASMESVRLLAAAVGPSGPAVAVGGPLISDGSVYNALHVCDGGRVVAAVKKHRLPNVGVFDEPRVFTPGLVPGPVTVRGVRVGFAICEDWWTPEVAETLQETGAELLVSANGSPYEAGKHDERVMQMVARVVECDLPLAYVNLVGGQDDQVHDGGSFVLNRRGRLAAQLPFFEERAVSTEWVRAGGGWRCEAGALAPVPGDEEADYRALATGLRDFLRKNGFREALLGLSGGIDSALVAALAADALGPEHVRAVLLPSRFTSDESVRLAAETARRVGCRLERFDIEPVVEAIRGALRPALGAALDGVAGENIQARSRGLMLMGMANARGELLLATGNKSEMAVGYATLYGDMCGGYAVLKDVYKTRVYQLARWRNATVPRGLRGRPGAVVPTEVINRAPTAELRPNQRDEDSLPPYPALDAMLGQLVEGDVSADGLVRRGHDRAAAERAGAMLAAAEFKRFQSPPGPKITRRAFWLDRRYPVTSRHAG